MLRTVGRGKRFGLLVVPLAVLGLVLVGLVGAPSLGGLGAPIVGTGVPSKTISPADSPTLLYFNGTVAGNGGTQTVYTPSPPNGTVWDLVSAKITITATSAVSTMQNSYLYDSVCTQLDVAPAPSACNGIYGPNVNGWANDVMEPGRSGTVTGECGYGASAPAGVSYYCQFKQTIHLTYDIFLSFGADLSKGVSSSYYLVLDPEVGDYPSFAFFRYSHPVEPLSSTPTTVSIPGPPVGYEYRLEIAWTTIDFGSALGPYRLAELTEEPSGLVLAKINNWTSGYSGASACGGYSSGQTCISDNGVGTATVWDDDIVLTHSDSFGAEFVGVSGDSGDFAVVVTEYPASASSATPPAAPTGLTIGSATSSSLGLQWTQPDGGGLLNDTVYYSTTPGCAGKLDSSSTDGPTSTYTLGSLPAGTTEYVDVTAWNATGQSAPSTCISATTSSTPGTNDTFDLELIATTPGESAVPGVVVPVSFQSPAQFPSVTLGPTNASGGAVLDGLPSGATIANVSVDGSNYTLLSYSVATPSAGLVLIHVVVVPAESGGNHRTHHPMQFTERGLGSGAFWWVSVTGPEAVSANSTGSTIGLELENGTYQYTIGASAGFNASAPEGTFVVPNSTAEIAVNFTNAPSTSPAPPAAGSLSSPTPLPLGELVTLAASGVALALGAALVLEASRDRRPHSVTRARRVRLVGAGRGVAPIAGTRRTAPRRSDGARSPGTRPSADRRTR